MFFRNETHLKSTALILTSCAGLLTGCVNFPKTESTEDLGSGFHHDVIAERTANSTESVGHFDYLFYRDQRLGRSRKFAVAPSGQSIIYQDAVSGNVFVFKRNRNVTRQLTSTFPGEVDRFVWDKGERLVTASMVPKDNRMQKRRFPIPD